MYVLIPTSPSSEETDRKAQPHMAICSYVLSSKRKKMMQHWVQILCLSQNLSTLNPKKKVSYENIYPLLKLVWIMEAKESGPTAAKYCTLGANWTGAL